MIDAVLLAGGNPSPDSPLYSHTQGKPKASLDIGGKPMLQWVVDALEGAETINKVVVVGSEFLKDEIQSTKIARFVPEAGDMMMNFKRGADLILEINPAAELIAIVSADIPLITPESVDWVINHSLESEKELNYFVIDQFVMEERFPESGRSYTRLKDMSVCGGDLAVIHLDLYTKKKDFWNKLIKARKSSFHQAALIGIDILLLLVLRRLTLDDVVLKVTHRLNITGKGLLCPYPEIGMDIDKPQQLELARRELT
jgi:GTP:adenosylcobinamide-phosphate guanylyltransferase